MHAAVWRTRPARSISLWLTIWASAGLSLRTGRKARDQRMGPRSSGQALRLATAPQLCGPCDTTVGEKATEAKSRRDTHCAAAYVHSSEQTGSWVDGFGIAAEVSQNWRVWGTSRFATLGTFVAEHPRGLTSNRHAGRPDRMSIRAFAFQTSKPSAEQASRLCV